MSSISYKNLEVGKVYVSNGYFFIFGENILEKQVVVKFEKLGVTSLPHTIENDKANFYVASWRSFAACKVDIVLPNKPILFIEEGIYRIEPDMGDGRKISWKILTDDKLGWIIVDDWNIFEELSLQERTNK